MGFFFLSTSFHRTPASFWIAFARGRLPLIVCEKNFGRCALCACVHRCAFMLSISTSRQRRTGFGPQISAYPIDYCLWLCHVWMLPRMSFAWMNTYPDSRKKSARLCRSVKGVSSPYAFVTSCESSGCRSLLFLLDHFLALWSPIPAFHTVWGSCSVKLEEESRELIQAQGLSRMTFLY